MWIHEVDIHLAISAFSAGSAFGMALTVLILLLTRGKK